MKEWKENLMNQNGNFHMMTKLELKDAIEVGKDYDFVDVLHVDLSSLLF